MRILLVDEKQADRSAIKRALRSIHARVQIIERRSSDGLPELLARRRFDCVLINDQLGAESGVAVLQSLKTEFNSLPPVIMIGDDDSSQAASRAFKAGAQDYVLKNQIDASGLWRAVADATAEPRLRPVTRNRRPRTDRLAANLTQMGNRALFERRLAQMRDVENCAAGRQWEILMVELESIAAIDGAYGWSTADTVLTEVGRRLCMAIRRTDAVFRLGHDEFAVILEVSANSAHADEVMNTLAHALHIPVQIDEVSLPITTRIEALTFPADAADIESRLAQQQTAAAHPQPGNEALATIH